MKKRQIAQFAAFVLILTTFATCKQGGGGKFILSGTLQGITDGKAILSSTRGETQTSDTVPIKNGKFVFTGDVPEPAQYIFSVEGKEYPKYFYAENTEMTLTGSADTLYRAVITGGAINEDEKRYSEGLNAALKIFRTETGYDTLVKNYLKTKNEDLKRKLDPLVPKMEEIFDKHQYDFIRQYPAAFFSAILVEQMSYGKNAAEIEEDLKLLDPKLNDFSVVEDLRIMVENMKTIDVSLDKFTSDAPDVEYAVDKTFAGEPLKDMVYLATFPDDKLCALRKDGAICLISSEGTKLSEFKSALTATPSALAIDKTTGHIYVLANIVQVKEMVSRGKTYKIDQPAGVECRVYDPKGTELKKIELEGLKSATGAKVVSNKLLVADYGSKKVAIMNIETGKMESGINDLRTCCRILDFGVNDKEEVLVANLGAFRVQAFDYSGKIKYAFGKRGQAINDFHGCCNPVNVGSLTNGAIVTVEKDPTRIKVYGKSGAKQIAGIQELVKGCRYIPMASDSKNNIYLASAQSGIIKCKPGGGEVAKK